MNKFFEYYIDMTAAIGSVVVTLLFTIIVFRKKNSLLWAIPTFFSLFGPLAIIMFMSAHLANNFFNAIDLMISRIFIYNFRYYSLILLGFVVGSCGVSYLIATRQYLAGSAAPKKIVYRMLLILNITAPLIPITPIAAVPSIAIAISAIALPFAKRRTQAIRSDLSTSLFPPVQKHSAASA